MELYVREDRRIVEIWLTGAEKQDAAVQEKLKSLYTIHRKEKYLVAVFLSGAGDLYAETRELLAYNRRRCAALAVLRGKRQDAVGRLVRRRREASVFLAPRRVLQSTCGYGTMLLWRGLWTEQPCAGGVHRGRSICDRGLCPHFRGR